MAAYNDSIKRVQHNTRVALETPLHRQPYFELQTITLDRVTLQRGCTSWLTVLSARSSKCPYRASHKQLPLNCLHPRRLTKLQSTPLPRIDHRYRYQNVLHLF